VAFKADVFRILISSPSDTQEERKIISEEIQKWNQLYSTHEKIVLLPIMWETHSASRLGDSPQEILNKQIVEDCDALIGTFWTRAGTPTKTAESGTLEEIHRLGEKGKLIMLYFSNVPVPPSEIDHSQLEKVSRLKEAFYKKGIVGDYNSIEQFRQKLTKDLVVNVRDVLKKTLGLQGEMPEEAQKDRESNLKLIESFPADNQPISGDDVKKIYLKFNKPIDFDSTMYIGNYYVRRNSFCQWNICGWIQMDENDTKLIWHVSERELADLERYGPQEVDYHTFEIHIGRTPDEWRVRAKDGDKLPLTKIRVKIKPAR